MPHGGIQIILAEPLVIGAALSGEALLAAWERGAAEPPPSRALAMLRACCPTLDEADAAALPVTLRDRALVALHAQRFGPGFSAVASCAQCGERLEFTLPAQQVAAGLHAAAAESTLAEGDVTLHLRLANTRDLIDAAAAPDLAAARDLLLARCTKAHDSAGNTIPVPQQLCDAALDRLDAMHEVAEISLTLACPACDTHQAVQLDIAGFLWAEIRHAAQRLLDEVHELAWAYGWSESAILAMGAARRQAYLDRLRA
jgi:hypothetical protein